MAGFTVSFGRDARSPAPPSVLELRVHGVNNTTPAALLDLPADAVEIVAGDKLGSFWMRRSDAANPARHRRGHEPDGVRREAYSWGGMVRTTPNFGGVGAAGVVAGVVARVLYAILLPFSIGNAVQWSRRLTRPGDDGAQRIAPALTAGLARLFGLVLTLLFTTTAAIVSIDVLGAQCAIDLALCEPVRGILEPIAAWPAASRLALFSLGPVAAVVVLWLVSALSRQRYDVLPGMESNVDSGAGIAVGGPGEAEVLEDAGGVDATPTAPLSQPGFWANRITADLARLHLAAAIAFTAGVVAVHAAMRGYTECAGLGGWETCIGDAADSGGFHRFVWTAIIAAIVLLMCTAGVCVLPTQSLTTVEGGAPPWSRPTSNILLGASIAVFVALLALLTLFTEPDAFTVMEQADFQGLYGGGFLPLAVVAAGALLALSGTFWRPWRGRTRVAWAGCAPAVFMTLSLVVATGTSAIVVVTAGDLLNSGLGASSLVREPGVQTLNVPSSLVALGTMIVATAVVGTVVVLLAAVLPRRDFSARAAAWGAPARPGDTVIELTPGVMPVSQRGLFARITAKRIAAARMHLAEPAVGVLTVFVAVALVAGSTWTLLAYAQSAALWNAVPERLDPAGMRGFIDAAMWGLAAVGALLIGVLASGASSGSPRPLGIVWDIACYLPRTGHPFGPPSFAERAVPEIAGRVHAWLTDPEGARGRRVVLVAHSMGAVLAVSALGLLASSEDSRKLLKKVSLLTFGVQLRAYFGRMLPDLLGPEVLGTRPARAPRLFAADPWAADAESERSAPAPAGATGPVVLDRLSGTLVPPPGVRWASLWRLTDFLGFPAMSTAAHDAGGTWINRVDRYADEIDPTQYMLTVGTHGEYFRQREFDDALDELRTGR